MRVTAGGPMGCFLDLGGPYSRRIPYTLELLGDAVCTHEDACDLKAFANGVLLVDAGEFVDCSCGKDQRRYDQWASDVWALSAPEVRVPFPELLTAQTYPELIPIRALPRVHGVHLNAG